MGLRKPEREAAPLWQQAPDVYVAIYLSQHWRVERRMISCKGVGLDFEGSYDIKKQKYGQSNSDNAHRSGVDAFGLLMNIDWISQSKNRTMSQTGSREGVIKIDDMACHVVEHAVLDIGVSCIRKKCWSKY